MIINYLAKQLGENGVVAVEGWQPAVENNMPAEEATGVRFTVTENCMSSGKLRGDFLSNHYAV